ncbi:TldD/PmbA family protein [Jannaschia aquimarina]|uniref:Peptidase PmbA n=1 Tax=Jannaschia aquimarina TaxID=935700 RepID=A0A0D1ELR7_9RHOB|nr:TldD/PmbA family protein [Jannaschia aquimarina]KIT16695.1 peptidase PmbA [Jannaschia aquimarina]SNS54882.1 microcin-processing peptidase 1. Unknown type peptidase. MEROPS family U62 [Jannaschia aquimarina]
MSDTPQSDLPRLCDALLDAARKAGAEAADALAVEGTSVSVDVLKGKLEHAERSEGVELGLRVLIGKRQACISASDIRPETMATMAERAVAMAREAPEDPHVGLAPADALAERTDAASLDLVDTAPAPSPADLQDMALAAEAAALAVDGVAQVSAAGAGWGERRIHLAATNGFSGGYARTGTSLSCVAISGEGLSMERDYYGDSRTHAADLDDPAKVGRLAGERAVARAGSRKPPTGAFPVVYDERVASTLIGHLLGAINGSSVARGSSFLRDAMGQDVLPAGLSVWEDPHLPRLGSSKPFDAEGLATARRDLVADGVLQGWVLDLATARKLGLDSTANATRGTSSPPSPGVTNIRMTEGAIGRDALLAEMGTGLLITSLIGSSVNATTGDYSRGASGFWVENGQISYPVNECTVAGNLRDMLRTLTPANDARPHLSRAIPSLRVEGLTVAGS